MTRKNASPNETNTNKKKMLEALKNAMGIVSTACENVGIARVTHYDWMKKDDEYKEAVHDINQRTGDFVEGALLKKIKDGDTTGIIFYCKTKLKNRGYIERIEQDVTNKTPTLVINNRDRAKD